MRSGGSSLFFVQMLQYESLDTFKVILVKRSGSLFLKYFSCFFNTYQMLYSIENMSKIENGANFSGKSGKNIFKIEYKIVGQIKYCKNLQRCVYEEYA